MSQENLEAVHSAAKTSTLNESTDLKRQKESSLFWNSENTMEFFNDAPLVERMLQILTNQPDLILDEIELEKPAGPDPFNDTFTLYASSKNKNAVFDLELIRKDTKTLQQTTREADRQQSMLNAIVNRPMLVPKAIYDHEKKEYISIPSEELPETYTLYLMEEDLWKDGLPTHTLTYAVRKDPSEENPPIIFDDGAHLILLNGACKESESDFGKLMHDLRCASSDQMLLSEMKAKARSIEEKAKESQPSSSTLKQ